MKKVLTAERRHLLTSMLVQDGSIKVGEAARHFGVSTETIRKDIIYLEKKGLARKSHGGAVSTSDFMERPISERELMNFDAKNAIATEAINQIPDGGVIILDAGSTNYALAKQLTIVKGLTIFTNATSIVTLLADSGNSVFALGGRVRGSSLATVGKWTNAGLAAIQADVAFMGSDGFLGFDGPTSTNYEEAEVKKNITKAAQKSIILADSSKFNKNGLFEACKWSEVDGLITDAGVPKDAAEALKEKTEVVIV